MSPWWRWPCLAAGLAALAYGCRLALTSGSLPAVVEWLAGSLVLHDALLAPLTVFAGVLVTRIVPHDIRPVVAGGLVAAACLVLVALPALLTPGVPDYPTTTPRNYGAGLAVLLLVDALATTGLALRARRTRLGGG